MSSDSRRRHNSCVESQIFPRAIYNSAELVGSKNFQLVNHIFLQRTTMQQLWSFIRNQLGCIVFFVAAALQWRNASATLSSRRRAGLVLLRRDGESCWQSEDGSPTGMAHYFRCVQIIMMRGCVGAVYVIRHLISTTATHRQGRVKGSKGSKERFCNYSCVYCVILSCVRRTQLNGKHKIHQTCQ